MSPAFEAYLARIYTDAVERGLFLADPRGRAAAARLAPAEVEALARIDRDGLTLAAESFGRKRKKMKFSTLIRQASDAADVALARSLFEEYQKSLGISLCFQNFDEELATLPGAYAPPSGRLLLAFDGDSPSGCVALRKIEEGICELKRLWVRPAFRGTGLGRLLVETILREARTAGYRRIRLDTLPSMREAQALYFSLGFSDIPPYNDHPIEGTRFMEASLPPP